MFWKNLFFLIILFILHFNCLDFPKKVEKKKKGVGDILISLPPSPTLKKKKFIEKYTDGNFSVYGVLSNIKSLNEKEISVKGYVYSLKTCPEKEETCSYTPHLYIVDDITLPEKMLMVYAPSEYIKENFKEREGYIFKGKIAYYTPDKSIVNLDGILILEISEKSLKQQ